MNTGRFSSIARLLLSLVLFSGLVFGAAGRASAAAIWYVSASAGSDSHSGMSWGKAFKTLQKALSVAVSGDQIWVAKGTYKPSARTDISDPRSVTFKLENGVTIYGGFAGTESSIGQRHWKSNPTILSGNIGDLTKSSDNAYHVVTADASGATAILDGFYVMAGNANCTSSTSCVDGGGIYIGYSGNSSDLANLIISGNAAAHDGGGLENAGSPTPTDVTFSNNFAGQLVGGHGGGMSISDGGPHLVRVVFSGNKAQYGGGLFTDAGNNPMLTNVTFKSNVATTLGGGMYNHNVGNATSLTDVIFNGNKTVDGGGAGLFNEGSSPTLNDIVFSNNTASSAGSGGGGLYNFSSSNPALTNVTFSGNKAGYKGGGMWNENSNPALSNVTFYGNTASAFGGGGMYNDGSDPTLNNTTFSGNSAVGVGDGMYNVSSSFPTIKNSIFWGDGSQEMYFADVSALTEIYDSIVEGGQPDNSQVQGLISGNPHLGPLQNNGSFTRTMALGVNSAAIDAGGTDIPCASSDQRGVNRPQGLACDVGAYEVHAQTFNSVGTSYDGDVLESARGSNKGGAVDTGISTFLVGDDSSFRRYRGFLSFDTSGLPDTATIIQANLSVIQQNHQGDPFIGQNALEMDIAKPFFGSTLALVPSDWQVIPTASNVGTLGYATQVDGSQYTTPLNSSGRSNINKSGTTQFRLRLVYTPVNPDNWLNFYSGNYLTNKPTLIVYYNP